MNESRKFTNNQIKRIRDKYNKGGISIAGLAKQNGIGKTTMRNIIKGFTYKDVN